MPRLFSVPALASLMALASATAEAQTQVAVEYRHSGWDHYFVTTFPAEIANLDAGAYGGVWARTGKTFDVYGSAALGVLQTCRFFSTTFDPRSSHFYTPYASECASLQQGKDWQFEGIAFYLRRPDTAGNCISGSAPVYRLYNNGAGGAPNHRYTGDLVTFNQMKAAGWTMEGDALTSIFACGPAPVVAPTTPEGLWAGSTSQGKTIIGLILDTNTYYFLYTYPYSNVIAGVIQGSGIGSNGVMSSTNARDFNLQGYGVVSASISGSYVPRSSLSGHFSSSLGNQTFSASFNANYDKVASLTEAAGTYSGSVASSAGFQSLSFYVYSTGTITGSVTGCSFSGIATPHGTVNAFDLVVTFSGGYCVFGNSTLTGIAYYVSVRRGPY